MNSWVFSDCRLRRGTISVRASVQANRSLVDGRVPYTNACPPGEEENPGWKPRSELPGPKGWRRQVIAGGAGRRQTGIFPEFDERRVPWAVSDARGGNSRIELEAEICSKLSGSLVAGVLKYTL